MSRITITISIDVPEGSSVSVGNTASIDQAEGYATLAPVTNGGGMVAASPDAPLCGIHHKPMRIGRYGPFCTQKAEQGQPTDAKGYCAWKAK